MTPKERHRNLEPPSAEFICALAGGCGARRLLEIGGSSGLSTIALAAAARRTGGRLVSIEIEALELVLIDCEKDDYVRFLGLLKLSPGAVVVADNILSHDLREYVEAVRAYPGVESVTLPIGKGLEVSRFVGGARRGKSRRARPMRNPGGPGPLVVSVVRRHDCSHGPLAIDAIVRVAVQLGLAIRVEDVVITTDDEARAHRCLGSPTVLVAGNDVEPEARARTAFGVT